MHKKCKLEGNFLSVVHFHVVDGHKVLMEVASDESFHQSIFALFKEFLENFWLLLVQREVLHDNTLLDKVLEIDFLP